MYIKNIKCICETCVYCPTSLSLMPEKENGTGKMNMFCLDFLPPSSHAFITKRTILHRNLLTERWSKLARLFTESEIVKECWLTKASKVRIWRVMVIMMMSLSLSQKSFWKEKCFRVVRQSVLSGKTSTNEWQHPWLSSSFTGFPRVSFRFPKFARVEMRLCGGIQKKSCSFLRCCYFSGGKWAQAKIYLIFLQEKAKSGSEKDKKVLFLLQVPLFKWNGQIGAFLVVLLQYLL